MSKITQFLFGPFTDPVTPLAKYRLLSPHAGIRVSPLQMGTMSLGQAWGESMGDVSKEEAFELLDAYFEAGGGFFDAANGYQNEESERWLGERAAAEGPDAKSQFRHGVQEQTEAEKRMSAALEKVGAELGGKSITTVALAYVLAKAPYVFPVVGWHKKEQLLENIQALEVRLSPEQVAFLESVIPFDPGFPHSAIGFDPHVSGTLLGATAAPAWLDLVRAPKPIGYD